MLLRWFVTVFVSIFLLTACTKPVVKPVVQPQPEQVKAKPQPKKVKKRRRPAVVILVSETKPAYQQVADELKELLPKRSTVVYLSSETKAREQLRALLRKPKYQQFVAVGLAAAKEAKVLAGREDEIIFCQVFNYHSHNLIDSRTKGVGALPGTASMFASWKQISPGLKSVGVITGAGLKNVIAVAASEASKHGIQLKHKVVNTDKEMLFAYKKMAPSIQGLWLLPDNRVLSGRMIKEVMSFSVRNTKQVSVFSDDILRLGGLLSVTTSAEEIAAKVAQRLNEAFRVKGVPGPDLMLLEDGHIQVNAIVAKRYNHSYSTK